MYNLEEFKRWLETKDEEIDKTKWDWRSTVAFYRQQYPQNFNDFILETSARNKHSNPSNWTLIEFVSQWKSEVDKRERERGK